MRLPNRLEVIAFVTGFSLLTFELAAARLLAPAIGSSTYVWTSVISVIIAALSVGYVVGGKLADARKQPLDVVWLLLAAAANIAIVLAIYKSFLEYSVNQSADPRWQALGVGLILFGPTSFFIGTIAPYLAKLNVSSLAIAGQAIASLEALNAIGGIVGTLLTGFVFFGLMGVNGVLAIVVVALVVISWLIMPRQKWPLRLGIGLVLVGASILQLTPDAKTVSVETPSSHYGIIDAYYRGQPIRALTTDTSGIQSGVNLPNNGELVFWYTQQLARITEQQKPSSVLILGGGALTLPQYLSEKLPDAQIDAVEIDPKLGELSRQYFGYKNPANVNEIYTDARRYLNTTEKKYDVILVDVYSGTDIPFSLLTVEFGKTITSRLSERGVIAANIIGNLSGQCREIVAAADSAYRSGGLKPGIYAKQNSSDIVPSNVIQIYSKHKIAITGYQPLPEFYQAAYTDNYMPAERLHFACQQTARV